MSDMFAAYNIAETGLSENQEWINAVSDNIANINTDVPTSQAAFQARFIEAQAVGGQSSPGATANSPTAATDNAIGSGVEVTGVALGSPKGILVSDPGNPMADAQGMIRAPDIDLGQQMTQLIMAQRGYEANLAVVSRATQAYQSALGLSGMIAAIGAVSAISAAPPASSLGAIGSIGSATSAGASPFSTSAASNSSSPFSTSLTPFAQGTSPTTNAFGTSSVQTMDPTSNVGGAAATQGTPATSGTDSGANSTDSGSGFSDMLGKAVDSLQATQSNADTLATQAATGNLTDVQNYMVAAQQADVATQLTVAVRNGALTAFDQIMNMQF